MAYSRQSSWLGGWSNTGYIPVFVFLLLATLHSSYSANNDYYVDVVRESPSTLSDSTLRHIMQLVTLGTGLSVPPPINLRYREKSLKRARVSAPHPRRTSEQQSIGSEFLGKRASPELEKKMGSEFLGKRMGSEFLGKRASDDIDKRMGSEFLGKRMGSEFLGKRMGSEFLGKRMGSEFLGKRMGSEFLGKRMGSEFLGKRSDEYEQDSAEDIPLKRMGSEFLGKRSRNGGDGEAEFEHTSSNSLGNISHVFETEKRMGSEFLGRKKRDTKTTHRRTSEA
ncbi:MIP-related peptides-like [Stegodyphus dumicola]|uniref:MIP-related peptides-like n=1 Tax=Stegodyphus dumicola TaxID=202533 RepID=UPI0015AFFF33|nr:MIP-related peptides-like [Stegodyphus dumicola]